ncbi:MAG TPA: hypothetical protein VF460_12950 [Burkholderiales bacterium]
MHALAACQDLPFALDQRRQAGARQRIVLLRPRIFRMELRSASTNRSCSIMAINAACV